jgi:hypothetical protein
LPFVDLLLLLRANSNARRHSICINPSRINY